MDAHLSEGVVGMSIISKIRSMFSSLLRKFSSIIREVFPTVKRVVIAECYDVAMKVVEELNASNLSNDAKRKEAFQRIKDEVFASGKEVKDSIINILIEFAVQKLKNMQ